MADPVTQTAAAATGYAKAIASQTIPFMSAAANRNWVIAGAVGLGLAALAPPAAFAAASATLANGSGVSSALAAGSQLVAGGAPVALAGASKAVAAAKVGIAEASASAATPALS